MGWAIQCADGTYRAWNRWSQSDVLQNGERWVELDTMPVITFGPKPVNPMIAKLNAAIADPAVPQSAKDVMSVWLSTLS